MDINYTHSKKKIYLLVAGIWLLLLITVMSSIIVLDIKRDKALFHEYSRTLYQQTNDRVHVIESVLDGFSAMVSVTNDPDRERIRKYAKEMLEQYPHIFMFEIVEKIPHNKIKSFTEYYRRNTHPDFEVKAFSYETDRKWQSVGNVPYHMPIVFMEPFPEESRKVLGLDLGSNKFFMRSLGESEENNRSISSDPFKLVEGDLAYIIHRPVPVQDNLKPMADYVAAEQIFAVLVIRADTILNVDHDVLPGMRTLLYKTTYHESEPKGYLDFYDAPSPSSLESLLFSRFRYSRPIESTSQPFTLLTEQQLGWGSIRWVKLALTLLIALFTFGVMISFARLYFRNEIANSERYLQISKAMIIGLDCNGNVKLINTRGCEILGYNEKELLGKNWFEAVVPGGVRDGVYKSFKKVISGEIEPLRKNENEVITKSGDRRAIEWNNDIEKNLKGEIVGTLSSGQDITDRKLAEADVQRQQRDMAHVMRLSTVGEMATGLAHELNQPLTALVSYCGTAASMVQTMTAPPQQLGDILHRAMDQAHRAGDIIRHLRDFAGNKESTKELFLLDQVIKDTILFLKGEVQHAGAGIELRLCCQTCSVFADKVQIEQVLVNLIRNSLESFVQAGISDGHIVIKSSLLKNNMAEVIIADNGPGIDATITNKIFDQFQTTKETGMRCLST